MSRYSSSTSFWLSSLAFNISRPALALYGLNNPYQYFDIDDISIIIQYPAIPTHFTMTGWYFRIVDIHRYTYIYAYNLYIKSKHTMTLARFPFFYDDLYLCNAHVRELHHLFCLAYPCSPILQTAFSHSYCFDSEMFFTLETL